MPSPAPLRARPRAARLLPLLGVLLLAPSAAACESCREALAHGQADFSKGLNDSILFMLSMVFLIPSVFGLVVWNSYRRARTTGGAGPDFDPGDGRRRWS